jgi:hypothetical protein
MDMLVIKEIFDVEYYRGIIEVLEDQKNTLLECGILDLSAFSRPIMSNEVDNYEYIINIANGYLDRFLSENTLTQYFQIKNVYDFDGINRAIGYFSYCICTYEKAIVLAKSTLDVVGF